MLVPITPILIALSAASPFAKNQLSDHEHRWDIFERATDKRSSNEVDPESSEFKKKPRFSSASRYISNHAYVKDFHNDLLEHEIKQCLTSLTLVNSAELDDARFSSYIASHLAFTPLEASPSQQTVEIFRTQEAPEPESSNALDKLIETDFNAIGLKPGKTADGKVCWRIEFRAMDIQLTDFENAALTIAMGMIANVINTFDLDFVLPISLVDENMKRAHLRDALTQGTFWWKIPKEEFANISRINDLEETNYLKSNFTTFGRPREEDFDNTGHFHHQHH